MPLEAINYQLHADLKVSPLTHYGDFTSCDVVPIMAAEYLWAAREYPLFFMNYFGTVCLAASFSPVPHDNCYIDTKGAWQAHYIPTAIRFYPFKAVKHGQDGCVLAINTDSRRVSTHHGIPLFTEDRELSEVLVKTRDYLTALYVSSQQYEEAFEQLQEYELLDDFRRYDSTGTPYLWKTNIQKLKQLDESALAKLRESRAVELAYTQHMSMFKLNTMRHRGKQVMERHSTVDQIYGEALDMLKDDDIQFMFDD